ncbi:hypothetical protein KB221_13150 [Aquidulcibacter paucihalophilus]|nr:hypothetical protein KB221_13150 [Aquidulcibacter paucihalophilus]
MTGFEFWGSPPLRFLLNLVGEGFESGAEPVGLSDHNTIAKPDLPRVTPGNRRAG